MEEHITWECIPLAQYQPRPWPAIMKRENRHAMAQTFNDVLITRMGDCFPHICIGLFGSAADVLHTWAAQQGALLLEPPTAEELLRGDTPFWPAWQDAGNAIVIIPELERCFLRHHRGLRLVRQLIEAVWAMPRRLLIGCDAWGWKYLMHAVQIDMLCTSPFIIAPQGGLPVASLRSAPPISRDALYVLHTLIVHSGLSAAMLPKLLPLIPTQAWKALTELRQQNLAEERNGQWRAAPEHYAEICRHLTDAGFWISDI